MDVVVLAAGTSSRMGKTNKLLLKINGQTLVANTCLQALEFLAKQQEPSTLIVVTGYRHQSTLKALKPCVDFIQQSNANIKMIVVRNEKYKNGQFSSAKVGVGNVTPNSDFFIQLADMPLIKAHHFEALVPYYNNVDAVRPFSDGKPGHPVLLNSKLKNEIMNKPDNYSVSKVLNSFNIARPSFNDSAFISDIDTSDDVVRFN